MEKGQNKMENGYEKAIIKKAEELGELIAESPERQNAMNANDRVNNDREASAVLDNYNRNRREALNKLSDHEPTKEELEDFRNFMNEEFGKLIKNPVIAEYLEANKKYDSLVERVNAILTYYITGQEAEGSCSGSCSTCGGCR